METEEQKQPRADIFVCAFIVFPLVFFISSKQILGYLILGHQYEPYQCESAELCLFLYAAYVISANNWGHVTQKI